MSRQRISLLPSPLKSPVADDRPDGRIMPRTETCKDRAVHEPDRDVAAGVAPENVGLAVAVEVAGADDWPRWSGTLPRPPADDDCRAVHQPDRHVAAGVAPENVAVAVAVEVAGSGDGPDRRHIAETCRSTETAGPFINQIATIAAGVAPEPVGLAVAVEVALADDRPVGRHRAERRRLAGSVRRSSAKSPRCRCCLRQAMSLLPSPLKSWVSVKVCVVEKIPLPNTGARAALRGALRPDASNSVCKRS